MIKRMTKTTSLLVAAAAIVSLVPATGVNAATKLTVKEGTIESAIAFDNGNYIFDGYKSDDDDAGIYFNDGSKDKLLEDVEDYNSLYKYGTKYAVAVDGSDEYMIDLSTGKVSDEDTDTDLTSTLKTKLTTTLRKTKRYEKNNTADLKTVKKISANQFGEVWYEYTATTAGNSTQEVTGYTNQSGKYIDASVTANIYVLDTNENKMVKIEEFGDTEGNMTVKLAGSKALTIAEDNSYIYRIVEVDINGTAGTYYLQKISKAQGDKEEGAYLPKSVESYLIASDTINKDAGKAKNLLAATTNTDNEVEIASGLEVRVVDGAIYVTELDSTDEEVTVTKLVLKRNEKVEVATNKRVDYSLVKYSDDVDVDAKAVSIDVDGNVWVVYNGKISKSVKGGDFEVVYTCDRTIDSLDVYNEGSLVAWDSEGDVYTTVQEGKDASKDEAEDIVGDTTTKTGWEKNADGTWVLYGANGAKLTGWQLVGGTWYYMDKTTAIMKTGWVLDGSTWYYCNASGAMQTGWLLDGSTWYYLQANGAMKTGWLKDTDGRWYFLNANGSMAANTVVDGYKLGANGAWIQ